MMRTYAEYQIVDTTFLFMTRPMYSLMFFAAVVSIKRNIRHVPLHNQSLENWMTLYMIVMHRY